MNMIGKKLGRGKESVTSGKFGNKPGLIEEKTSLSTVLEVPCIKDFVDITFLGKTKDGARVEVRDRRTDISRTVDIKIGETRTLAFDASAIETVDGNERALIDGSTLTLTLNGVTSMDAMLDVSLTWAKSPTYTKP